MVKGISRQVIVVHSPDPKLFDQAIFILKENALGAEGVTDEALLKEAQRLIRSGAEGKRSRRNWRGAVWAAAGALATGAAWVLTLLL